LFFSPAARVKHDARLRRFKGVTMEQGVVRAAVGTLLVHAIPPRAASTLLCVRVRTALSARTPHKTIGGAAYTVALDGDSRRSA